MNCKSLDLTIEGAMSDPVIGAMMRADRIEPRQLEASLRATAQRLETRREATRIPGAAAVDRVRRTTCSMVFAAW